MYYPLSKQRIDAQIPEKGRSWTETSKFCNCSVTRGLLGKGEICICYGSPDFHGTEVHDPHFPDTIGNFGYY